MRLGPSSHFMAEDTKEQRNNLKTITLLTSSEADIQSPGPSTSQLLASPLHFLQCLLLHHLTRSGTHTPRSGVQGVLKWERKASHLVLRAQS